LTVVLVIGGRSKIGSALIDDLLERGQSVRALVRDSERGASLPAGVQSVVGDLADPATLAEAMRGVEKVFLLCGPTPDEVQLNKNAIDAAKRAGVGLVVRSSILAADPDSSSTFIRDHGECDQHLRSAGIGYAIVRPHMFMQNIPESTIPSIDQNGNFYANAGDARISMVDTRDVAAVAAVLLTEPGHEGEEHDVTGPEGLSYDDVAGKLTAALGREIGYVDVPDDAVRQALSGFGLGDWMVDALVQLLADYRASGTDGYAAQVADTVRRLTGSSPRTLDKLLAGLQPAHAS
jgi:uncharacterized protein YbjT (DUF2867 family)